MAKYNNPEWIGQRFGRLVVLEPVNITLGNGDKEWRWRVRCDCGCEKVMKPITLINGKSVSCGCYRKGGEQVPTRHCESHTHLHNIWCGMNNRCNPNHKNSHGYGERGIGVCAEWRDYEKFAKWARGNGYKDGLSIDRIDVNGDYCPDNCRWIPMAEQARNRRTTHWVEYDERKMSLAEACEISGLPYKQVFERIVKRKWDIQEALSTPIGCAARSRHK